MVGGGDYNFRKNESSANNKTFVLTHHSITTRKGWISSFWKINKTHIIYICIFLLLFILSIKDTLVVIIFFYNGKAACKPIKWRKSRIGNNKNYDIYKILANYATHLKGEYIYPCYNVILLVTLVTNVWTGWEGLSSNPQNWQKYHDSTSLLLLLPCFPTHQIIHCLSQPVTFFDLILEFVPESSHQWFSLKMNP